MTFRNVKSEIFCKFLRASSLGCGCVAAQSAAAASGVTARPSAEVARSVMSR